MIKLTDFVPLSKRKTVSGRFLIDWTKTIEWVEIPHGNKIVKSVIMENIVIIQL